jgi:hypothetical protein
MKSLIVTLFCICCFMQVSKLHAQGNNLQFNQALFIAFSEPVSIGLIFSQTIIVPANKVWKIESASLNSGNNINQRINPMVGSLSINDNMIFNDSVIVHMPIWVPSGSYTLKGTYNILSGGTMINGFISGIEYNIVP